MNSTSPASSSSLPGRPNAYAMFRIVIGLVAAGDIAFDQPRGRLVWARLPGRPGIRAADAELAGAITRAGFRPPHVVEIRNAIERVLVPLTTVYPVRIQSGTCEKEPAACATTEPA